MEKKKQIGEHIVDHLSERMNEEIVDPVLDEWLAEDESNQEDFKRYKEIWKETGSYLEQETFNAQYAWDKIYRINKERDNKRKRLVNIGYIISGVAATLLLVLGFSKMGVFDKQPEMLVRMTADYGSRSEVVLPDGSVVKLNSGSDITYSYNAKENIREVNFQGEGFFDVSKNKIPFVIKMSNGLRLKVHGTSFNLQAYTDEKTVEASLVEGCIELDHGNDKIPGDMLQTIFEKFYRVDGSRSTGTGGAGLGLAIAKQIVELHGGRILAKSDDNQTQFVVTLPSKEKTEQKEGSKDEVHTHRRLAFRGKTGRGKRLQSK